jgi:hypothetical protein
MLEQFMSEVNIRSLKLAILGATREFYKDSSTNISFDVRLDARHGFDLKTLHLYFEFPHNTFPVIKFRHPPCKYLIIQKQIFG